MLNYFFVMLADIQKDIVPFMFPRLSYLSFLKEQ